MARHQDFAQPLLPAELDLSNAQGPRAAVALAGGERLLGAEPRQQDCLVPVWQTRLTSLAQLAPRRLLSAPDHDQGFPKLRPASAYQPVGPRWPAISTRDRTHRP